MSSSPGGTTQATTTTSTPRASKINSPTAMDSLLKIDVSTLSPDVVMQYTKKVTQLHPSSTLSPEKLQMLLVLSQKLLKWFIEERVGLENTNRKLEKELLEALEAIEKQQILIQSIQNIPQSQQKQEPLHIQSQQSPSKPSLEGNVQISKPKFPSFLSRSSLPSPRRSFSSSSLAKANNNMTKATETVPNLQASATPSKADEVSLPSITTTTTTTNTVAITTAGNRLVNTKSPLEVYVQVNQSIIRVQKLIRGYVTRRRFFKMLQEIVNLDEEIVEM